MDQLKKRCGQLEDILLRAGAEKYAIQLTERQTGEFNAEDQGFTLYRTMFDNNIHLTVFREGRMGAAAGNDLSPAGLEALAQSAVSAAMAAEPDPCHDIAPQEPSAVFRTGCHEPDMDRFFDRSKELLDGVRTEYPLIRVMLTVAKHVKLRTVYRNSNGTTFEKYGGYYNLVLEYAANDGENTTGIDYVSLDLMELDRPFLDQPQVRRHLKDTIAQLHRIPVGEKFTGTVIFTPECLESMLYALFSSTITGGVILNGTSRWLDRVGEQVTDPRLSVLLTAGHPENVDPECFTADGFRTQPVQILDHGVLKNQILSLFVANKTGRPVTRNTDHFYEMDPGSDELADMIASVKRGLIVGGFSGGEPEINGEFSGVAKNSFYVEDGKIQGAVMETMISGNLFDLFRSVSALSKQRVRVDLGVLPYLAADGVIISGKS